MKFETQEISMVILSNVFESLNEINNVFESLSKKT